MSLLSRRNSLIAMGSMASALVPSALRSRADEKRPSLQVTVTRVAEDKAGRKLCQLGDGSSRGIVVGDSFALLRNKSIRISIIRVNTTEAVGIGASLEIGDVLVRIEPSKDAIEKNAPQPSQGDQLFGKLVVFGGKTHLVIDVFSTGDGRGVRSITVVPPQIKREIEDQNWERTENPCRACGSNDQVANLRTGTWRGKREKSSCDHCKGSGFVRGKAAAAQYLATHFKVHSARSISKLAMEHKEPHLFFDPFRLMLTDKATADEGIQLLAEYERQKTAMELAARRELERSLAIREQNLALRVSTERTYDRFDAMINGGLLFGAFLFVLGGWEAAKGVKEAFSGDHSYAGGAASSSIPEHKSSIFGTIRVGGSPAKRLRVKFNGYFGESEIVTTSDHGEYRLAKLQVVYEVVNLGGVFYRNPRTPMTYISPPRQHGRLDVDLPKAN